MRFRNRPTSFGVLVSSISDSFGCLLMNRFVRDFCLVGDFARKFRARNAKEALPFRIRQKAFLAFPARNFRAEHPTRQKSLTNLFIRKYPKPSIIELTKTPKLVGQFLNVIII